MTQNYVATSLPSSLYSQASIRAMDIEAQTLPGLSASELMEKAGEACFHMMTRLWPQASTLSVICGSGNNGGDGYVIARKAVQAGWDVRVFPVGATDNRKVAALAARNAYIDAGGAILEYIPEGFENAEILVDALLGIGLNRDVPETYAAIIAATRRFRGKIFAVDVPSGLCSDTGAIMGDVIRADATMTFIAMKPGLLTGKGPEYVGELFFDDLGIPAPIREKHTPEAQLLHETVIQWPKRPLYAHKGMSGHVLVIGGDHGYAGAARLSAEAALRTGAGLVTVASRREHALWIGAHQPELMCHGIEDSDALDPLLEKATVIAIGPGLGKSLWAHQLLEKAIAAGKPMVIDADALNLLAERGINCPPADISWILTPHPGEAARLLGLQSASGIETDRMAAVRNLQERYGGIAVLKGFGTLIQQKGTPPLLLKVGNPGMASAGMGDVLTGMIAALRAQGMPDFEAARCGVWLHGKAADHAAATDGMLGMTASDVIRSIRLCRNS